MVGDELLLVLSSTLGRIFFIFFFSLLSKEKLSVKATSIKRHRASVFRPQYVHLTVTQRQRAPWSRQAGCAITAAIAAWRVHSDKSALKAASLLGIMYGCSLKTICSSSDVTGMNSGGRAGDRRNGASCWLLARWRDWGKKKLIIRKQYRGRKLAFIFLSRSVGLAFRPLGIFGCSTSSGHTAVWSIQHPVLKNIRMTLFLIDRPVRG